MHDFPSLVDHEGKRFSRLEEYMDHAMHAGSGRGAFETLVTEVLQHATQPLVDSDLITDPYMPYRYDSATGLFDWQKYKGRSESGPKQKLNASGSQRIYDLFRAIRRDLLDELVNKETRQRRLDAHFGIVRIDDGSGGEKIVTEYNPQDMNNPQGGRVRCKTCASKGYVNHSKGKALLMSEGKVRGDAEPGEVNEMLLREWGHYGDMETPQEQQLAESIYTGRSPRYEPMENLYNCPGCQGLGGCGGCSGSGVEPLSD